MSKVVLRGHIQVPPGDLEAVVGEMENHIRLTRAEPGCLAFEIAQDEQDQCRFEVYEEFSDQAAFERHQTRVEQSEWGEVAKDVARHYEFIKGGDHC